MIALPFLFSYLSFELRRNKRRSIWDVGQHFYSASLFLFLFKVPMGCRPVFWVAPKIRHPKQTFLPGTQWQWGKKRKKKTRTATAINNTLIHSFGSVCSRTPGRMSGVNCVHIRYVWRLIFFKAFSSLSKDHGFRCKSILLAFFDLSFYIADARCLLWTYISYFKNNS